MLKRASDIFKANGFLKQIYLTEKQQFIPVTLRIKNKHFIFCLYIVNSAVKYYKTLTMLTKHVETIS